MLRRKVASSNCGSSKVLFTGGSAVPVMLPEPRSGRDSSLAVVALPEVVAACGQGSAADMLKPYQLVGLNWMLLLKRLSVGGCILADEMVRQGTALPGYREFPRSFLISTPALLPVPAAAGVLTSS